MRLLALLVASLSFGQCASGLLLAGPHSDLPGQPWASAAMVVAALAGGWLALALWRRRPAAASGLPLWGAGMALWIVGLTRTIASPAERQDARVAVTVGLTLWAGAVWLATRYARRRLGAAA